MNLTLRLLAGALFFLCASGPLLSQPQPVRTVTVKVTARQVEVRSTRPLSRIMVWTPDGNRLAEHRDIRQTRFSFQLPVFRRLLYVMVVLDNGKVITEKIAVL